ncbi:hypothetical protein Sjap_022208 [Stephania japonica]|uniref:Uncharacterized protein n=1 Tax=Stephania japonica TaxID=461633 RepID=A0AAP0ENI0_9MAGN
MVVVVVASIKGRAAASLPPPPLLWAMGPYKGAPSSPEKGVGAPLGGSSFATPFEPFKGEERGGSSPFLHLDDDRTGGGGPLASRQRPPAQSAPEAIREAVHGKLARSWYRHRGFRMFVEFHRGPN